MNDVAPLTPGDFASFAFIITLAAVVNGLGIVAWLSMFAAYLRRMHVLTVQHYWVFSLFAAFQFMTHILMWWSLWGVRGAAEINFLMYVYLLAGPVLLFLGTSMLVPSVDEDAVDMKAHYSAIRPTYSTVLILLWLWAIFLGIVLRGEFAPTLPVVSLLFLVALAQRFVVNAKAQGVIVVLNWLLLAAYVVAYAMKLGGTIVRASASLPEAFLG